MPNRGLVSCCWSCVTICLSRNNLSITSKRKCWLATIDHTETLWSRLGRFPPVVRTAVPVDGRFEHIVLSCNATSDHAIIWIQREAQRAMDVSPPFLIYLFSTCFKLFYWREWKQDMNQYSSFCFRARFFFIICLFI